MPHSLYLGSGIIQSRLLEFDRDNKIIPERDAADTDEDVLAGEKYRPSVSAIQSCMSHYIVELSFSLFTFALFVNSAILIVAGASLSNVEGAESADLFGIHALLSKQLAPVAGTIFALALLLSGISAGIVCTIAGQMISEGHLTMKFKPWMRRLLTRSISITPSIIIAGAVGAKGLSTALEASQVALSVILPFVSAPLIYFTCRNKYMTVGGNVSRRRQASAANALTRASTSATNNEVEGIPLEREASMQQQPAPVAKGEDEGEDEDVDDGVKMCNNWFVATLAVIIWLMIVVMNIALLVLVGLGIA